MTVELKSENIENKEVTIIMENNERVEGVVVGSDKKRYLTIAENGNWDKILEIDLKEVRRFVASEFDYYDFQHKTFLRESKIPQFQFRFSKDELNELLNSYLSINYDGKLIEGKLKKYFFSRNNEGSKNAVLVIENEFETKEIQDYRLRSLSVIGKTELEHGQFLKFYEVESELRMEFEEKYDLKFVDFSSRLEDPDSLLDEYFSKAIELKENEDQSVGALMNLEKYNYNWISEVVREKKGKPNFDFSEELHKSKKLTEYYNARKTFILYMLEYVSKIDWVPLFGNQKKGEIEALNHLYEANLIS